MLSNSTCSRLQFYEVPIQRYSKPPSELSSLDCLIARSALYFRETSPRTTDSVRSVRIIEEILYGGSEVVDSAVVKYVIFGRFWRGPRKIPLLSRIKQ